MIRISAIRPIPTISSTIIIITVNKHQFFKYAWCDVMLIYKQVICKVIHTVSAGTNFPSPGLPALP